jgi:hypothetical protein
MATVRIRGWGGQGRWRWFTDDQDPPNEFRARGWGGDGQWKTWCPDNGTPTQGNTGGPQWKLHCD